MRDIALSELQIPSLLRTSYSAGALIMTPDTEPQSTCFCVVKGRVRLYWLSPIGEQIYYDELEAGDCLNSVTHASEDHRPMFAQAVEDTTIEVLPAAACTELMEHSLAFNKALVRHLSVKIMYLGRRLYEATALSMRTRLHTELLRLAQRQPDGTSAIWPAPTHQDLAMRIGSQREAVSKELARLSRDGIVRRSGSSIILLQEGRMREEIARAAPPHHAGAGGDDWK
jgi:CRP-like cAMP-binding protein